MQAIPRNTRRRGLGVLLCALLLAPWPAWATFSIAACDPDGNCGVAVATHNLAVGASVPHAQARVGALASQFETHLGHGPQGLALLAQGMAPERAIQALLAADGGFDGGGPDDRQLGVVAADGRAASFSGAHALASGWAGALHGHGFSVQGNGLAGPQVLARMRDRFLAEQGPLPGRLMAALEAGYAAGGQSIGAMSAALLVRTPAGAWQDVDLRVDASPRPVADLRALLDRRQAWDTILQAERRQARGDRQGADAAFDAALALSHDWDRVWRRAARLAMAMGDHDRARRCLLRLHALNPVWTRQELRDPLYAAFADDPAIGAWRD